MYKFVGNFINYPKHRRAKSSTFAEHAEKTNHHVCIEEASVIARGTSTIVNLGRRLRLKKGLAILIETMAGKLVDVGSLLSLPSWFPTSSLGFISFIYYFIYFYLFTFYYLFNINLFIFTDLCFIDLFYYFLSLFN